MNNVKYVDMDVHKSITVIVVLNELGQFESRSQIKTKAENIRDFFRGISGKVEVVFEEGAHSAWLYKLLKPLVASPDRLRSASQQADRGREQIR